MSEHLMQRVEALAYDRATLLLRLKDVTRICEAVRDVTRICEAVRDVTCICEAVRYTSGLGKHQWERIEAAKKLIAEIEAANSAA